MNINLSKHYSENGLLKFKEEMEKIGHNEWKYLMVNEEGIKNVSVFRYFWEIIKHVFDFQNTLPNKVNKQAIHDRVLEMIKYGNDHYFIDDEVEKSISAVAKRLDILSQELPLFKKPSIDSTEPSIISTVQPSLASKLSQIREKYFEKLMGFNLKKDSQPINEWINEFLNLATGRDKGLSKSLNLMKLIDKIGSANALSLFSNTRQMALECRQLYSELLSLNKEPYDRKILILLEETSDETIQLLDSHIKNILENISEEELSIESHIFDTNLVNLSFKEKPIPLSSLSLKKVTYVMKGLAVTTTQALMATYVIYRVVEELMVFNLKRTIDPELPLKDLLPRVSFQEMIGGLVITTAFVANPIINKMGKIFKRWNIPSLF